ncbi:tRNA (N6-threonylcarbamoyladenosine(37)-N6)-methyltransferase TrmO [Marinomonas epiphytica]
MSQASNTESSYPFKPIGIVHSCYKEKFGIPRQPGLVTQATGHIELLPPYNRLDVLDGLSDFSHIWIQFIFHACLQDKWKAKVRPPRLGGKKKVGVFASRTTHRPNPIGLSVVKLGKITNHNDKILIELQGADLLDGTPVLDIKPYLPYADQISHASGGFAPSASHTKEVRFSPIALEQCHSHQSHCPGNLKELIVEVISQDPRPAYLQEQTGRIHGNRLWHLNITWQARQDHIEIIEITPY